MANTNTLSPLNNPSGYGPDYTLTYYGQVSEFKWSQNSASACTVSSTDRGILRHGPPFLGHGTIRKMSEKS